MKDFFEIAYLKEECKLPIVLSPKQATDAKTLTKVLLDSAPKINDILNKNGGILLRGFELKDVQDFKLVSTALLIEKIAYVEGQSPRTKVEKSNIYTSTEYASNQKITLHSELSYAQNPPSRILFFCQTPPDNDGETPIIDNRNALRQIPKWLTQKFEEKGGVMYLKNLPKSTSFLGKSWSDYFENNNKKEISEYLVSNNIKYKWNDSGELRLQSIRPASIKHPETKEQIWYNQADLWHFKTLLKSRNQSSNVPIPNSKIPLDARFGDGSEITVDEIQLIKNSTWRNASFFPWKQGDLLILDNFMCMHGRNKYSGQRKILVAMG